MSELKKSESSVASIFNAAIKRIVNAGGVVRERGESSIANFPVRDHFTPGLYSREIFMPAGSIVVSCIHKTEHPFVVSKGACYVYDETGQWEKIVAPHFGITKPGKRRFLLMLEDTIWTTFHVTQLTDVASIEDEIIERPEIPTREEIAACHG